MDVMTVIFACRDHHPVRAPGARVALVLLWLVASSQAAVHEVGPIGLTVGNLDREIEFYTGVLPFEKVSESRSRPGAADRLLGLSGTQLRSAELKLGDERIVLTEHRTNKGRPIPPDSRSFDHWFQHIAIVVSDMDAAYEHLRRREGEACLDGAADIAGVEQGRGRHQGVLLSRSRGSCAGDHLVSAGQG